MATENNAVCFEDTQKNVDIFFDSQPEMSFIEELKKPIHIKKDAHFGTRNIEEGEINFCGMYLDNTFPDEKGILSTAFEDFNKFLEVYEIAGTSHKIRIIKTETSCFEEYTISINEDICISANDTEGIRRALVCLEDLIIEAEGPFLKKTDITKRPAIKSRITRGFFSPTNRPPHNIDELCNDVDYYPDEYLNRLAHDGNNGIWIYTRFCDLIPSDIIPEYGEGSEKRIAKLKKVVAKCARYGIKVYVFAVEPAGLTPDMREKYPDIPGSMGYDRPAFCTRSEKGREYCIESVERLFTMVPDLGGYMNITAGERVTNCASAGNVHQCPRCSKFSRGETLAYTVDLIQEGMRRAGSKGEFISWTYGQREWNFDDIREYVEKAPCETKLMQNFEDYGFFKQLGKERFAMDYWLSYPGPTYLFDETAKAANKYNKHLYAKMQVCCSHELATMPYIPVPGLVFEKYKGARKWNVEGILQCWYFGNYPSVMSKAAGILSFMEDFTDKRAFLLKLAGTLYGKSNASKIADAWELFEEGYKNYPLNIMFSYYGPMHDGIAWELQLKPKNLPLPRTWLLPDKPNGDRIGDCLRQGHTPEEILELSKRICDKWRKGLNILPQGVTGEMETLSRGLGLLFESGANIIEFYVLREKLGYGAGNPEEILGKMKSIVKKEMENTKQMIPLCENDNRLGYHSEAEGFKFFPNKLKYRIEKLKELMATEFPEVQARIECGRAPLEYYSPEGKRFYEISEDESSATVETIGTMGSFKSYHDKDNVYLKIRCPKDSEIMFCFENRLMVPECEILINKERKPYLPIDIRLYAPLYDEKLKKEFDKYVITHNGDEVTIAVNKEKCNIPKQGIPFKLCVKIDRVSWKHENEPTYTLGKHLYSPEEFGWVILK